MRLRDVCGAGWRGSTWRRKRWNGKNGELTRLPGADLRELVGDLRRREWHFAHVILCSVFNPQPSDQHYKQFQKLLPSKKKTPLTSPEEQRWFSFESFLELMGLATLNQEDSGGLYALHAHINHSCEPNAMVSLFIDGADIRPATYQDHSPRQAQMLSHVIHHHPMHLASAAPQNKRSSRGARSILAKRFASLTSTTRCPDRSGGRCFGSFTVFGVHVRNVNGRRVRRSSWRMVMG